MAVKSKHGAGGEYTPDWRPKVRSLSARRAPIPLELRIMLYYREQEQESPPEIAPPPAEPGPPVQAKPGWRTVHVREERVKKSKTKALPPPAAAPAPAPMAPQPQLPAWAQWKRVSLSSEYPAIDHCSDQLFVNTSESFTNA